MPKSQHRKSLRERVADRKAGVPDARDVARARHRRLISTIGTVISIVGLFLLAFAVFRLTNGVPVPTERIILYAIVFIFGRALKAGADMIARFF